ncbi:MAG: YggS family pyridoxal phosphate-dependent enzyme [Candidatus Omnitrophota bacterium]
MGIRENLLSVQKRIEQARRNAPSPDAPVGLIGITKEVPLEGLREAVQGGLLDLGENRVQEAREKIPELPQVRWHMVGHLQRNKAKEAIGLFHLIHSVDSFRLAEALEQEASRLGKEISVLLQVKLHERATQYGVKPEEVFPLARAVAGMEHLRLLGLMTIAPLSEEPEASRPCFRCLRELKEALEKEKNPRVEMRYLSMGMSQDFEVAVEEGANLVRIGRAIFGKR